MFVPSPARRTSAPTPSRRPPCGNIHISRIYNRKTRRTWMRNYLYEFRPSIIRRALNMVGSLSPIASNTHETPNGALRSAPSVRTGRRMAADWATCPIKIKTMRAERMYNTWPVGGGGPVPGFPFLYTSASKRGYRNPLLPRLVPGPGFAPAVPRSRRYRFLPLRVCVRRWCRSSRGGGGFVSSFF